MKLNDTILLDYLQGRIKITVTKQIGLSGKLEGPLLYYGKNKLQSGWVYVAERPGVLAEGMHIPSKCLLVFSSLPASEQLPEGCACIVAQGSTAKLVNLLVEAFSAYQAWYDELTQSELAYEGAQELLERSADIFGNPLTLFTQDMSIIAKAAPKSPEGDAPNEDTLWLGNASRARRMEMTNALLQDIDFRKAREEKGCFHGPDYLIGYPSIMYNLKVGNRNYCISVARIRKDLTDADCDRLLILGTVLTRVLTRHSRSQNDTESMHRLFVRILEDRTLDYLEASRSLSEMGWNADHHYICLVYQLTYLDRKMLPIDAITDFMERQFPGCCSFAQGEEIVNFFDLDQSEGGQEAIENELKPFIRDSYLKAGYSRADEGHMNLRRMYVQAQIALDVGGRKDPYRWIHHFDGVAFPYIVEQITRRLPADMVCHEGVLRLAGHDKEHGTEYLETLKVWFDNGQNAVHSASALFIHRSTFLYRMEKIREIMESGLDDPEENIYIMISIRLIEREAPGQATE